MGVGGGLLGGGQHRRDGGGGGLFPVCPSASPQRLLYTVRETGRLFAYRVANSN